MSQIIFIPAEGGSGEPRVAASPDTVKRLIAFGLSVVVEAGAGDSSRIPDSDYQAAGAT
ncbi:NAD(P)(+) transhydrogenase (Re/Si-specific) subunit alpha, partial [Mesorhizobium sp. CAU 1732]